MKYLVVFSLIAAVASAGYLKPAVASGELAEIQEIVAAINSPSTDPATAAALEQLLLDTLGIAPVVVDQAPISVGPAIVEEQSPISVGPALIDFPLPDGGAVTAVQPESPALVPAAVVESSPAAASTAPLVQIILNIQSNQASAEVAAPAPTPADTPVLDVMPVQVVDEAVNVPTPVQVIDTAPVPAPVQVVDAVPEAVLVIDSLPVEVVDTPIVPAPVVILPDVLN